MIRAQFTLDSNQRITSFKMTGHADSGPYGQDICIIYFNGERT